MGKDPRDAVIDLVIADKGETSVVTAIMDEDDVRTALKHPLVGVGTDSGAKAEDGKLSESKSHPRAWGSFPRILGHYVRDEKLLTLEEAIRKMTSKAARACTWTIAACCARGWRPTSRSSIPATIRDVVDLRRSDALFGRRQARVRQRPARRRRRRDHAGAAWPGAARAGESLAAGSLVASC